jgi:hypothetical protein
MAFRPMRTGPSCCDESDWLRYYAIGTFRRGLQCSPSQFVNHESPRIRFAGARPSRTRVGAATPHPQNGGAPFLSPV